MVKYCTNRQTGGFWISGWGIQGRCRYSAVSLITRFDFMAPITRVITALQCIYRIICLSVYLSICNTFCVHSIYPEPSSDCLSMCRYRGSIHISGPLPGSCLCAHMADLTPDHTRGLIVESFHSWQFLSVSHFQVILGLPGPCFPSVCVSKAVLTAPLERSTCPYQRSLLSFTIRSRLC